MQQVLDYLTMERPDREKVQDILYDYTNRYPNVIDAINHLANKIHELWLARSHATPDSPIGLMNQDQWKKMMSSYQEALRLLWDIRKSEIRELDDTVRTTTPKGYRRTQEEIKPLPRSDGLL